MHTIQKLFASCLLIAGVAQAQEASLVDEVHTVATAGASVPVELSFDIVSAGSYEVTLTDLGAPAAPLAAVNLAVTQGSNVIGTPLTTTGTITFTGTALTTYVARVTGTPGAAVGSGLFRVDVRNTATSSLLDSFVALLAPEPGTSGANQFVLDIPLTVSTTGSYDVSLRDLLLPNELQTLLLAIVEEGGPLVATLDTSAGNPANQTVTLDSTRAYHVFSIAESTTPTAGGFYTIDVKAAGGGVSALHRTVPLAGVVKLGSINLAEGAHTLILRDLGFPAALSGVFACVVKSGELVAQATTPGDVSFVATAGPHDVYGFGAAAAAELAGSVSIDVAPNGAPAVFTAAHIFAPSDGADTFTYEASIANAANFRVRLADYQFPAAFQTLRLAAVQRGAVIGTPLTAPGTFDISAEPGKISLLAVARGAPAGSLFGVDVTPIALGAVAFETTQGVGGTFISRKISVLGTTSFDVRVSDLGFPAPFATLSTAVTRGSDRVGLIFGGGTFAFNGTPGNYIVNMLAVPGASQAAGTYALSVTERPAPPVVILTATPERINGSGAVDLTWSSQSATSCTARGGWSGAKAVSGTERSSNISTATTFTLACDGAGGTTTKEITVNVVAEEPAKSKGGGAFETVWLVLLALCVIASLLIRARALPFMVITASLLALSACGGAQSRYTRSMERGAEFLDAGDLDKARVEFRNAMQISPRSAEARYQGAVVAQRRGDFHEALASYQAALDAKPDYPAAQAALARIFLLAGAPDRAMETVAPGLAKHPDDVGLLVVRGTANVQLKKMAEAHADAERAVSLDPADEGAVALLSALLRTDGETQRAIALLTAALERKPDAVDMRRVLANFEIEAGNMPAAEEQLRQAVKIQPRELALHYELANFYLRERKVDAAQKALEAAVVAVPASEDAKLILVDFLTRQRSREVGEKKLRAMIAQESGNLDLRLGLGALFERSGADKEAIAAYRDIIERNSDSPKALTARNRLAAYYASHGDVPQAKNLLAEIVKINPRDQDALVLRAKIEIEAGNAAAAVVDLRTVLRDLPNSPDVHRMLARAHLENGDAALGEDALRKSLELAPTDLAARVALAQLLIRTGRADASVSMLEDAVRRSPNDAGVREVLVRAYIETRDLAGAARASEDLQVLLPKSPAGYYLRGQVAQLQKNTPVAEKQFKLAIDAAPNSIAIDALAALCRLQSADGRASEALARVDGLLASGEKAAPLLNLRGELLLGSGKIQDSVAAFEQAIAQTPKWWLPYRNLAIAKYSLKDADGAIRTYEQGIRQIPGEMLLVVDLAALYELQKRSDDAIRVYETFHAANPKQELITNNLAKVLLAHRDDPKSLARTAELTAPFASAKDPALLDTYGWSLYRRGDFTQAQQVLESAFARAPESGSIRYHLALVQVKTGQLKKAIDNLEIAVASPRGFVGLAEARTLLVDLKTRDG